MRLCFSTAMQIFRDAKSGRIKVRISCPWNLQLQTGGTDYERGLYGTVAAGCALRACGIRPATPQVAGCGCPRLRLPSPLGRLFGAGKRGLEMPMHRAAAITGS